MLLIFTILGYIWINDGFQINGSSNQVEKEEEEEEDTPDPLRNFTTKQLRHFDGKVDDKTEEAKPVYLSVGGTVFDVSKGRDFYGPGEIDILIYVDVYVASVSLMCTH